MATTTKLTLDQFPALPESKPTLEYVCSEVIEKTTGIKGHALVQSLLVLVFNLYLRAHPIGLALPEWRRTFGPRGDRRSLVPDFAFIANERAANDRMDAPHDGPPDLAVEVLSPDDQADRLLTKIAFYLLHGMRLVWVIDPICRTATVFAPDTTPRTLTEDDTLDGGEILPGFSVRLAEVLPPVSGANEKTGGAS